MKWFRIEKENSVKPTKGTYSDWKETLSIEGKHQCVYCAISEKAFGGIRNFHVEHYKPKSDDQFPELINDYNNLFYACSICNGFKSNDWPNAPTQYFDNDSYIDPSAKDYCEIFAVNNNHELESDFIAGRYMIERLFLNRAQLRLERKEHDLRKEKRKIIEEIGQQAKNIGDPKIRKVILTLVNSLLLELISYKRPFTQKQIKRK